jgi:Repeat of unknown function (DUF346)
MADIREGALYRESSQNEVYMVLDGKKILIPSQDALHAVGMGVDVVPDGTLDAFHIFNIPSGSTTPASLVFPPDYFDPFSRISAARKHWPLKMASSTRMVSSSHVLGVDAAIVFQELQLVEIRGWLAEDVFPIDPEQRHNEGPGCDIGFHIVPDYQWLVLNGVDINTIIRVGNIVVVNAEVLAGQTSQGIVSIPAIHVEFNSWNWNGQIPPLLPNPPVDWVKLPSATWPFAIGPFQKGQYVKLFGSLVTDSPHEENAAWGGRADIWSEGLVAWAEGHHGRWTEIHPVDLIELPSESWSDWEQLGANPILSNPAAVSWGPNRIDVFVQGTDNALYTKTWDGTRWSDYSGLGGAIASGPTACSWAPGRLDVFAQGADGTLQHIWYEGSWSDWEQLGANLILSNPAAVSWGPNRIDVFVQGTDNAVYTKTWDGTRWSDYSGLGGTIASGPTACSWAPGRLDVFARGADGTLQHIWYEGSWSDWEQLGANPILSNPAAVSWGPNRIDVFVQGTDNAVYTKTWDGTRWSDYSGLGGTIAAGPAVCSWAPGRLDVFGKGADNALWYASFDDHVPTETVYGLVIWADVGKVNSIEVMLQPKTAKPDPSWKVGFQEVLGPECVNANPGPGIHYTSVEELGDAIRVIAQTGGGNGVGATPGRIRALYRVWWEPLGSNIMSVHAQTNYFDDHHVEIEFKIFDAANRSLSGTVYNDQSVLLGTTATTISRSPTCTVVKKSKVVVDNSVHPPSKSTVSYEEWHYTPASEDFVVKSDGFANAGVTVSYYHETEPTIEL